MVPSASVEAEASNATVSGALPAAGTAVNRATGATLGGTTGGAVTVTLRATVPSRPELSRTVSTTA